MRAPASLRTFLGLLLLLSLPFWLAGELARRSDLAILPAGLPASAVMAILPAVAALILTGWRGEAARRVLDMVRRPPRARWMLLALALPPAVFGLVWAMRQASGAAIETPATSPVGFAGLALLCLAAALTEEVGWQGHAYPLLRRRLAPLSAGLVLGAIWAVWHVVPYLQGGHDPAWIVGQCLFTVALRLLIVEVFEASDGALAPAILIHAGSNLCWTLFPGAGPATYDPWPNAMAAALFIALGAMAFRRRLFAA